MKMIAAAAADPELLYALAVEAFYALDHMLATLPPDETVTAAEIGAVVRLIRDARDRSSANGRTSANDD